MKKSIFGLLLVCLLQIDLAFAQNAMNGVVSDANGPLVGVVVYDKDNGKGTTSNVEGKYTLSGAEAGHTIEFRHLGYMVETVVWNGQSPVNILLKEDAVQLEETVVIGYGAVKKKDLTGAVGVINSSLIERQSTSQLSQSLQGLIPGLTVTRTSSMPGASATVQVRGVTTLSDSSPLILVDGMMVSSLDNIGSEEIQQITVLKDAASASIYGARAAAGVILITTKEATEGQLSIGYNGEVSLSSPTELPEFLTDPYHYMTMYNEWSWNDAGNPAGGEYSNYSQDYINSYAENNRYDPIQYPNYDWKNAILSSHALRHKHNLTMTYGNKVIKSHTSATYENVDAIYRGSNHERISVRSRNNLTISKKLSGSIDLSARYATKNDPTSGSPLRAAYMYPSIYLGLYPDGRVGPGKEGSLSNTLAALLEGGDKKTVSNVITGKFSLSYKPIEDLTITANLTPTIGNVFIKEMKKAIPVYDAYETDVMLGYVSGYTSNSLSEERRNTKSLEKQFIATYAKTFDQVHNFNAMVGYEDYIYTYETMSASTNDMSLSSFPYLDLANKNALAVAGNSYQNAYRSFFGRVMYNYDGRYYVQLNARADGSSRFHKDHRWGFFPSASVGWVISNEKFMQQVSPISYLKLRASIGTLGNERIGNYPYQTYISFNNAIMYDSAGATPQSVMSAAQQDYAYPDIHWEKTQSWDIGVDAAFFDNRLNLKKIFVWICGIAILALIIGWFAAFWSTYNYSPMNDSYAAGSPPRAELNQAARFFSDMKAANTFETSLATNPVERLGMIAGSSLQQHFFLYGFLAVLAISLLRFRFAGFPIHPILFLIWGSYPSNCAWASFLIGWFIKQLVVRFGGGGVYQKCKPLFVGLIAGEILVIGITIAMDFAYYLATGSQSPVRIWFMPG